MVSLRRLRYMGLCAGKSSMPVEQPKGNENDKVDPVPDDPPMPTENGKVVENTGLFPETSVHNVMEMESSESPASPFRSFGLPKEETQYYPGKEIKRRKRHRRKQYEDQEPCIMRGVYFKNMKWQAAIKVDKKQIHLGTVETQEEAARLYDRAAFMCGREPNFDLGEEEKRELRNYTWADFLSVTRKAITSKKCQRKLGPAARRKKTEEAQVKSDTESARANGSSSASTSATIS